MKKVIYSPKSALQGKIFLPSSKSISNRMLILNALAGSEGELLNISCSDDSLVLNNALEHTENLKDIGHAGTAMRFLTAYLSLRPGGPYTLTGSTRMKQRPIAPLVEALRSLGAGIKYLEDEGFPPLEIDGSLREGGQVGIDAGVSSQYISALMMIAPLLEGGLEIRLEGRAVSETYTRMTAELMKQCGAEVDLEGELIRIPQGSYRVGSFEVESDWSAASYWFQAAALQPGSELVLRGLKAESLQGDAILMDLFSGFGIESRPGEQGIRVSSLEGKVNRELFTYDFTRCPDLVQTLAVTCCALERPFRFSGCSTLRVKETDRITALQKELGKLGYVLEADPAGEVLQWTGERCKGVDEPLIETYHDHRMAMAFAPMAIVRGRIAIEDPAVVTKSYPSYWEDLELVGFGF